MSTGITLPTPNAETTAGLQPEDGLHHSQIPREDLSKYPDKEVDVCGYDVTPPEWKARLLRAMSQRQSPV
ncbi:hypothetical protein Aspvir_008820 [Aspergillus viridinutans]|uniref:Uncharacterized protein n=1 Tax=Aspergillus viridinutans TaxID=75553 RepID=A0A9P3C3T3_ASPVI|nr:uncharacterized protein Aspvir_008820 [Aspergillus viridinutans]GIK04726.1 hypothetical protein Aspvir_008820 [Aspergillus viridinutans]